MMMLHTKVASSDINKEKKYLEVCRTWPKVCRTFGIERAADFYLVFLLVSTKRVVQFRCGFRCLVAYSGWKKF